MPLKRIFVTGASGCVGHYIAEALIQETNHELFFLVRNPSKLKLDCHARPGINVLQGDLREIEQFSNLLQTVHCAVLAATAWGGLQEVFDINVDKTLRLLNLLNPETCQQVFYFSTASLLGRNGELLHEASEIGTDYIRSKYICLQQLSRLAIAPKIATLFPTFVLGGDEQKPYSHLSAGLAEVLSWINLIRFLKIEGSFHYIHGRDIAQVMRYLISHSDQQLPQKLILGNQRVTINQFIEESSAYLDKRIYFRLSLSSWLANLIISVFRIQMADWDRFCMKYQHFTYQNPVSPTTFDLPAYCATLTDVLQMSGVPKPQKKLASTT